MRLVGSDFAVNKGGNTFISSRYITASRRQAVPSLIDGSDQANLYQNDTNEYLTVYGASPNSLIATTYPNGGGATTCMQRDPFFNFCFDYPTNFYVNSIDNVNKTISLFFYEESDLNTPKFLTIDPVQLTLTCQPYKPYQNISGIGINNFMKMSFDNDTVLTYYAEDLTQVDIPAPVNYHGFTLQGGLTGNYYEGTYSGGTYTQPTPVFTSVTPTFTVDGFGLIQCNGGQYALKVGDTLNNIATKYNITTAQLINQNAKNAPSLSSLSTSSPLTQSNIQNLPQIIVSTQTNGIYASLPAHFGLDFVQKAPNFCTTYIIYIETINYYLMI